VIVENRPGTPACGKRLTATDTPVSAATAASASPSSQFRSREGFRRRGQVALVPLAVVVPADSPAKTIKDFISLANEKPGQLNFSSAGLASTTYLAAEVFKQQAKINILHVPYRGLPEATTAVVRGDVAIYFLSVPSAQELSAAGKLRVLAVNSAKRLPQLPDAPTLVEAGVPGYKYDSWFGVMAPAGTPKAILSKVSQDIAKALQLPDVTEKLLAQGSIPAPTTPEQFDAIIKDDTERYSKILKDAGIEPQ
jgi:tripartite-type tricarboxylate transporter receptor subunit TctC